MKKLLFTLVVSALSLCVLPSQAQLSTINGKWERGKKADDKSVALYVIKNGGIDQIATSKVADDGAFCFAINNKTPEMYVIGMVGPRQQDKYSFFFNPGDALNIVVTDSTYYLEGKNTKENLELEKWHNQIFPLEYSAMYDVLMTFDKFFPQLEDMLPKLNAYKSGYAQNVAFNKLFDDKRKLDILNYATSFITSPRTKHPSLSDFTDFYKKIDIADYSKDDALLRYPFGVGIIGATEYLSKTINSYNLSETDLEKLKQTSGAIDFYLTKLVDDQVKGEYVISKARLVRSYDGFLDYKYKYGKYLVNEDQKERLNKFSLQFGGNKAGETAINFTFPDQNGKQVSLADFKGKVVYVDVWATWCGPCKQEIPHLKKLEEAYHGKDVVFLSVSIDAQKDYDKWKKMLVDENLKGVQVFGGDKSKNITQPYNITGIPRFILVGKDGKLISGNAPRPSNEEMKLLLDKALSK